MANTVVAKLFVLAVNFKERKNILARGIHNSKINPVTFIHMLTSMRQLSIVMENKIQNNFITIY